MASPKAIDLLVNYSRIVLLEFEEGRVITRNCCYGGVGIRVLLRRLVQVRQACPTDYKLAFDNGTTDNVSVMVILLNDQWDEK